MDSQTSVEPSLSIVLLMSRSYEWLRLTIQAWGRQTIHDQIEAVLIKPASLTGEAISSSDFEPFHSHRIHDVPLLDTTATGFAAGVREARAPVVMLAEDHAFPDAHLAESILQIFRTDPDVVAVGPVLLNANPQTAASEASFVVAFSGSAYVRTTRAARSLAGHNGSYRRDFLLQYGDGLADMYKAERLLQYDIEARGKKMILLAEARMQHWNSSGSYLGKVPAPGIYPRRTADPVRPSAAHSPGSPRVARGLRPCRSPPVAPCRPPAGRPRLRRGHGLLVRPGRRREPVCPVRAFTPRPSSHRREGRHRPCRNRLPRRVRGYTRAVRYCILGQLVSDGRVEAKGGPQA